MALFCYSIEKNQEADEQMEKYIEKKDFFLIKTFRCLCLKTFAQGRYLLLRYVLKQPVH